VALAEPVLARGRRGADTRHWCGLQVAGTRLLVPRPGAIASSRAMEGGRPMLGVRCLRQVLGALLPVALAAQEVPRQVEPERLWRLDTGG